MARRRRKMLWAAFGTAQQTLGASAVVFADLLSIVRAAVPSINNFTIVRIRGFEGVRPNGVQTSPAFYESAIMVITQAAFDAAAGPDPENDDASYMYRNTLIWSPQLVRETAAGSFTTTPQMYMVDVKAKRRVDQADNTLVYVIKNRAAIASQFFMEGMALLDLR